MITKILARLSYANVAATLALFVSLGGTAYAAATIGSADIKDNSIRSRDIHNRTIKAKDIRSGVLTPKLYGNVDGDDGTLVRGRGIVSSEKGGGNGFYIVRFKRDVTNCVLLASISSKDNINPASVNAGIAYYTANSDPRDVFVLTQDDASTRENADFSVAAFC